MDKYILIQTDGYSINTSKHKSLDLAQDAMRTEYQNARPDNNDESSEEMSSCNDMDAILYQNGEDVLVWQIVDC